MAIDDAVKNSILNSTKKNLGLDKEYDAFDYDVMTHINSCFFTLNQLGVGPVDGFNIEGEEETWVEFSTDRNILNAVKPYIHLRVRRAFDPPERPHHITALNEQIEELEHRLKTEREWKQWQAPSSSPSLP